jgi:hypothetical protein
MKSRSRRFAVPTRFQFRSETAKWNAGEVPILVLRWCSSAPKSRHKTPRSPGLRALGRAARRLIAQSPRGVCGHQGLAGADDQRKPWAPSSPSPACHGSIRPAGALKPPPRPFGPKPLGHAERPTPSTSPCGRGESERSAAVSNTENLMLRHGHKMRQPRNWASQSNARPRRPCSLSAWTAHPWAAWHNVGSQGPTIRSACAAADGTVGPVLPRQSRGPVSWARSTNSVNGIRGRGIKARSTRRVATGTLG